MKLKEKIAIVTGGGGFIGKAIAQRLGEEGARLVLIDINSEVTDAARSQLRARQIEACSFPCDICDNSTVQRTIGQIVEQHGAIDILINCAGGGARGQMRPFHEQRMDVIDSILRMNLMGTLHCTHASIPHMIRAGQGKIVNIGSITATAGLANYSEYAAAKAAVIAFTKSLAMELGQYNINVNCVSPGIVNREPVTDEAAFAKRTTWLNRAGTADDIASAVCFLSTPDADFITGQDYIVDGGRSLGLKGS